VVSGEGQRSWRENSPELGDDEVHLSVKGGRDGPVRVAQELDVPADVRGAERLDGFDADADELASLVLEGRCLGVEVVTLQLAALSGGERERKKVRERESVS